MSELTVGDEIGPSDVARLKKLGACREALDWLDGSGLSMAEAWRVCERGDWMLWYAARVGDRRAVVRCACEIARSVLHIVPSGDDRPRLAIEAAERWAEDPTQENRAASAAASAAASDASSDAARAAARAASSAAARAAAWDAAWDAARDAAWAAASAASLKRSADVVLRHFPEVPNG